MQIIEVEKIHKFLIKNREGNQSLLIRKYSEFLTEILPIKFKNDTVFKFSITFVIDIKEKIIEN